MVEADVGDDAYIRMDGRTKGRLPTASSAWEAAFFIYNTVQYEQKHMAWPTNLTHKAAQ